MRKRRHHYVPRFYLQAWAVGERIYCLREGRIGLMGLSDVAVEKDFYEVQDLEPEDIEVIRRGVIDPSYERGRLVHEDLLKIFARVATLKRCLAQTPDCSNQAKKALAELISNLDENYHEAIEHDLQIALKSLLAGNVDFFYDVRLAGSFLRALALQLLRTKKQ